MDFFPCTNTLVSKHIGCHINGYNIPASQRASGYNLLPLLHFHKTVIGIQDFVYVLFLKCWLYGRKKMFYLMTHSTHFYLQLYGIRYIAKKLRDNFKKKEICCHIMGYSFLLAARVLLHVSSHRENNTSSTCVHEHTLAHTHARTHTQSENCFQYVLLDQPTIVIV